MTVDEWGLYPLSRIFSAPLLLWCQGCWCTYVITFRADAARVRSTIRQRCSTGRWNHSSSSLPRFKHPPLLLLLLLLLRLQNLFFVLLNNVASRLLHRGKILKIPHISFAPATWRKTGALVERAEYPIIIPFGNVWITNHTLLTNASNGLFGMISWTLFITRVRSRSWTALFRSEWIITPEMETYNHLNLCVFRKCYHPAYRILRVVASLSLASA